MAALADEKFISLTTFKKSGEGVAGPMWVARDGADLVIWTPADSWKVKRLRRDPRVTLVPCGRTGKVNPSATPVEGTAEIVSEPASVAHVEELIKKKYGIEFHVIKLLERILRRAGGPRVVLRITLP